MKEEYVFETIEDFLNNNLTCVITGLKDDERSRFFYESYIKQEILLITVKLFDRNSITVNLYKNNIALGTLSGEINRTLATVLRENRDSLKCVMYDITSLDVVVAMNLTKKFMTSYKPKKLFASYIQPNKYSQKNRFGEYSLSSEIDGYYPVPGFSSREKTDEKLIAFLGFENARLRNMEENLTSLTETIPVLGSPSLSPEWYLDSLWNNSNVFKNKSGLENIRKCKTDSIFEAYYLLKDIRQAYDGVDLVLSPIGLKPHAIACALFAEKDRNARIVFDNPKDINNQTEGIRRIMIYHLTSFIDSGI